MIPKDLRYTKEHEWVRMEGEEAVIGITDHAQSEMGDITFVELPQIDKEVKQSAGLATVESIKAASDIYAPLSGRVIAVNEALEGSPEVINQAPYDTGWICRVSVTNPSEMDSLMDADAYEQYLEASEK